MRAIWFGVTLVLFFGGLVAFAGSLVVGVFVELPGFYAAVVTVGLLALVTSPFAFYFASYPRIISAATSADGTAVEVVDPSEQFAAELPSS